MISDLSESSQQALYRERFTHTGWSNVLNLAKSHIGCRFHGIMDVYNEIPTVSLPPLGPKDTHILTDESS